MEILATLDETEDEKLILNSPDFMHITFSVLNLEDAAKNQKAWNYSKNNQYLAEEICGTWAYLENLVEGSS